jgi:hypothetical protein
VVLQGYNYQDLSWEPGLKEYLEKGGIVVVDPFKSPDQNSADLLGLGLKAYLVDVNGSLESTELVNGASWVYNYSWEGDFWGGCSFEGSGIFETLRIGSYVGVGTVQVGQGTVILVGVNLLFHGLYTGDLNNVNSLKATIQNVLSDATQCDVQLMQDGHISLRYSSTRPSTVRVSENWFPHWAINVDGSYFGVPLNDTVSGVMLVQLPAGVYTVDLVYNDPYSFLRGFSLASIVLVVLFFVFSAGKFGLNGKKKRESFPEAMR